MRKSAWKEVSNCDTCQRTKWPNKKYGKSPAEVTKEIPRHILCVDINWLQTNMPPKL